MELLHQGLTDKILKTYFTVYNKLGYGFLERVYENAMYIELRKNGLVVEKQQNIKVYYDEEEVGNYFADLLINNTVIIELKAATTLLEEHENQLLNYLKATDKEVGLLLNFGNKPQFKRKIFENIYK